MKKLRGISKVLSVTKNWKLETLLLAFAVFLFAALPAWANLQLVQTNGPQGGYAEDIEFSSYSEVGYSLVGGAVYKSEDNGTTWIKTNFVGSRFPRVIKVADDGTIYVGQDVSGDITETVIYRSTDGGNSWNSILSLHNGGVNDFVFKDNAIFASVSGGNDVDHPEGIYKSTDGGQSWNRIGLDGIDILGLEIDNEGTLFALTAGQELYKSINDGLIWTSLLWTSNVSEAPVSLTVDSSGTLYVGSNSNKIYTSYNGGASWSSNYSPLTYTYAIFRDNDGNIYAGHHAGGQCLDGSSGNLCSGYRGIYKSTDNCGTWYQVDIGLDFTSVHKITADSNGDIYVATERGIYKTSDGGISWHSSQNGIIATNIEALTVAKDGTVYAGGWYHGLVKSTDGGASWILLRAPGYLTSVVTDNDLNVYVGALTGVYKSSDAGSSWTRVLNWSSGGYYIKHLTIDTNGTIYAATGYSGVYKSTDRGNTWTSVYPTSVHAMLANVTDLYVSSEPSLLKTVDGGSSWLTIMYGLGAVESIGVDSNGIIYAGMNQAGLYKSADNGASWSFLGFRYFGDGVNHILVDKNNYVYVSYYYWYGGSTSGLYISTNEGVTWQQINNQPIKSLALAPDGIVYAGVGSDGVYKLQRTIDLPRTGQTTSYAAADDGAIQAGVAWPNPRFTDNGDQTITDNLTGLIWLKDADCINTYYSDLTYRTGLWIGSISWQPALDFIAGINAGTYPNCAAGYSDWRLPNKNELLSLIDYGQISSTWLMSQGFTNIVSNGYWTSNTSASRAGREKLDRDISGKAALKY